MLVVGAAFLDSAASGQCYCDQCFFQAFASTLSMVSARFSLAVTPAHRAALPERVMQPSRRSASTPGHPMVDFSCIALRLVRSRKREKRSRQV